MAVEMFTNLNVVNNKFPCLKRFIFVKNYKLKTMISKQTPKGGKCVRWDPIFMSFGNFYSNFFFFLLAFLPLLHRLK